MLRERTLYSLAYLFDKKELKIHLKAIEVACMKVKDMQRNQKRVNAFYRAYGQSILDQKA